MAKSADDRIIGRLEEFQKHAEKRFDAIESTIESHASELNAKIDSLQEFKWRVAGGAAVLGVLLGAVGNLALRVIF